MAVRLEIVLIVLIAVTVMTATMVTLTDKKAQKHVSQKELEFTDTTFIEVDRHKLLAKAFTTYGVRNKGILVLEHVRYKTHNIEEMLADNARYLLDTLYLDGNISLHEKDGYQYTAQRAVYNQRTEILTVNSPFTAKMGKNIIKGSSMQYDALKKQMNGTDIEAVLYTVKK